MKFKGTTGMMVALLILGIYYFFVDLPAEQKKAQEKEIAGKILPFKKKNAISPRSPRSTLTCNRLLWA